MGGSNVIARAGRCWFDERLDVVGGRGVGGATSAGIYLNEEPAVAVFVVNTVVICGKIAVGYLDGNRINRPGRGLHSWTVEKISSGRDKDHGGGNGCDDGFCFHDNEGCFGER